uniref:DUF551 domain-containing protein n=1 Tax=Citrobacter sp. Cb025 TaxID=2985021 RepID=UPI00336BF809
MLTHAMNCERRVSVAYTHCAHRLAEEVRDLRAAMLQGAENVKSRCTIQTAPALDSSPKIAESRCSNSPVIPDGWVACSDRMPEENAEQEVLACFKGGDISTLYYFEGRWDDAYGIVPIRQDVTHWMPLPAAPQPEVK